ncbi:hypothetical protein GCM10009737_10860 [Nocardioides lentus]|uniref:Uncharacterized protein n=1 Tax=Nocardioides lentus TaxID=338077 RepID=A0ABN2P3M5_9ACTN
MTTTAVRIWCPDWCIVSEQDHLENLDGWGGLAIHHSEEADDWSLTAINLPDGTPQPEHPLHAPVMLMDLDAVIHPDDAERLAHQLLALVARARDTQEERR